MRKYRISLNDRYFTNIVAAILFLLLGIYIIIGLATTSTLEEYTTVEGTYYSYREVSKIWRIRNKKIFISIELPTGEVQEYRIHNISLGAFEDEEFLENVKKGDSIKMVLQKDKIVSIEDHTQSYLKVIDSVSNQENNQIVGYCVGGAFVLGGVVSFLSVFSIKRRRR